jgi:biopolymer transport protein ExbD
MNFQQKNKYSVEFSVASMADMVFLLLIFFLLTLSFDSSKSLKIDLPTAKFSSKIEKNNIVSISKDTVYAWNSTVLSKEDLSVLLEKVLNDSIESNNTVLLMADKEVRMQEVTFVLSEVARHGGKVLIGTKEEI